MRYDTHTHTIAAACWSHEVVRAAQLLCPEERDKEASDCDHRTWGWGWGWGWVCGWGWAGLLGLLGLLGLGLLGLLGLSWGWGWGWGLGLGGRGWAGGTVFENWWVVLGAGGWFAGLWALGSGLGLELGLLENGEVVSCAVGLGWARSSGFETEIGLLENGEVVSRPEKKVSRWPTATSNFYLFLS